MLVCFNKFMRSFVNKFSKLKITHCISSPLFLYMAAFLRTARAESTVDLEGRLGTSSFKLSSSQPSYSSDSGEWSFWNFSRMSSSVITGAVAMPSLSTSPIISAEISSTPYLDRHLLDHLNFLENFLKCVSMQHKSDWSSESVLAACWDSVLIPDFLKQSMMVSLVTASQEATSIG